MISVGKLKLCHFIRLKASARTRLPVSSICSL
uniref:Uncharacterized protein n=1 Tax=Rhizophora mucronata TaxID=61149 RepID=A0A2P2P1H5_RHIMU